MLKAGREQEEIVKELRRVYVDHWEQRECAMYEAIVAARPAKKAKPIKQETLKYVLKNKETGDKSGIYKLTVKGMTINKFRKVKDAYKISSSPP